MNMITPTDSANIKKLFSFMDLSEDMVEIVEADDLVTVNLLVSEVEAGRFIGRYAATLDALQLIISMMINQGHENHLHVLVDAGGYRKRREQSLEEMASEAGEEVVRTGIPHSLPPLSATERRQIHLIFKDHETLTTYSEGEGQSRRLIIAPKN